MSVSFAELHKKWQPAIKAPLSFADQLSKATESASTRINDLLTWLVSRASGNPLHAVSSTSGGDLAASFLDRARENQVAEPALDRVEHEGMAWLVDQFAYASAVKAAHAVLSAPKPGQSKQDLAQSARDAATTTLADRLHFIQSDLALEFLALSPKDPAAQTGTLQWALEWNTIEREYHTKQRLAFKIDPRSTSSTFKALNEARIKLGLLRELNASTSILMDMRDQAAFDRTPSNGPQF